MYEWAVYCMDGQFQIGAISPWRYFLCVGFVLACILSVSDDDNILPFWLNFIVWQGQVFLALGFFITTHTLMRGVLSKQNNFVKLIVSALIAVTLYVPISLLFDVYIEQETPYSIGALIEEWQNMVPPALISWIAINLPWVLGFKIESTHKQATEVQQPNTPNMDFTTKQPERGRSHQGSSSDTGGALTQSVTPETVSNNAVELSTNEETQSRAQQFLQLANINAISELIYLKAELHYLNVVLESGSHLILYNLKDAIDDISSLSPELAFGQTHRSYWVNTAHIHSLEKKNREGALKMSNQTCVPVSRTHMSKVKSWLKK
jgi:hypothetical protein